MTVPARRLQQLADALNQLQEASGTGYSFMMISTDKGKVTINYEDFAAVFQAAAWVAKNGRRKR